MLSIIVIAYIYIIYLPVSLNTPFSDVSVEEAIVIF